MRTLHLAVALIVMGPALVCANPMANSLVPAVSERQLYQFVPVIQLNTTIHMNNSQIMYVDALRIKVTLPWWTSVVGGTISFLLALKSVTWDWFHNRPPPPWTFSSPSSIVFMLGSACTFIQNFALLCTTLQGATSHRLGMITPVTGNAYLALFETAATLWTARMLEFKIARLAGWINASLSLLNFVLLSLPFIGTTGLYQVYSPYCTLVKSPISGFDCNLYLPHNSGNCSSLDELQIGFGTSLDQMLPHSWINYANWGYAGFIAILFSLTMRAQLYYVKRWKRLGATGGLHEKVETQDVRVDMDLIEEAQNKIQSTWRFAGSFISL